MGKGGWVSTVQVAQEISQHSQSMIANHEQVIHVRKPANGLVDSSNGGLDYLNSMHHNTEFTMKTETDGHLICRPEQSWGHTVHAKPTNNSPYE
jgi:hypothetical protein